MFNVVNFDRSFKEFFDDREEGLFAEVQEDDSSFEILADVPGVEKKDISIFIENRLLTISAKRERSEKSKLRSRDSKASYRLGFSVEEKDISADLSLGILRVKIPKPKSSLKKIEIS